MQCAFYLPRQLTARGEHALAAAMLAVAAQIHPDCTREVAVGLK